MSEFTAKSVDLYRYKVSNVTIQANDKSMDIKPERIKEIEIIEDFEKNVFPIFKLVAIVEPSVYKNIIKNKDDVTVTLVMNKYYSKLDSLDERGGERFIETKLKLMMNENVEDLMYTQKLQANLRNYKKGAKEDMHDLQMVDNAVELYLFKEQSLDGTKASNTNVIMKDATLVDAVAYIASSAQDVVEGGLKNILMTPPDNTDKYEVLLIPPLSILKAILYLDIYYGFYDTGSLIYFGLEDTYILKYTGGCTAFKPEEEKELTVTVPRTDNSFKSATLGQVHDENKYIGDFHTLDIDNQSLANNYIAGNGSQFVDSYTGNVNTARPGFNKNTSYLRLLENRTENEYLNTMYTKQSESNDIIVTVNLQDINVSKFTPNKEYKLSFEDSAIAGKYTGSFFISYAKHSFINTGTALTVNSQIILKKLKKE